MEEKIQPFVMAAHKGDTFGAMGGKDDPDLLAYAKREITRLRQTGGSRVLAEHDYESRIRCMALERLVAMWEPAVLKSA